MKALSLIVAAATVSFAISVPAQEMPGGLWEIKTKMDIPGMPPELVGKFGSRTITQCVKSGEKKWSEQRNPNDRAEKQCEPAESKVEGNKVTWKVKCKDGTSMDGIVTHNGKVAYTMDMVMKSERGTMKMHSEGKRIAATCQKSDESLK